MRIAFDKFVSGYLLYNNCNDTSWCQACGNVHYLCVHGLTAFNWAHPVRLRCFKCD